jgi:hypothetical protein
VYVLCRGALCDPVATAPLPEPTNDDVVQLVISNLAVDTQYNIAVWAQDQAGHRSVKAAVFDWLIASVAPLARVVSRPAAVSALRVPTFLLSAVWGDNAKLRGTVADATFLVSLVGVNAPHSPCDESGARPNCTSWCNGTLCEYTPALTRPGPYTLQIQAVLFSKAGDVSTVLWEYKRCLDTEYAVLSDGDSIVCQPCPEGGDCSTDDVDVVVQQGDIVARAGWWASAASSGEKFYRCPVEQACLHGNGTRAQCAVGYRGIACSVCALGYFEQFGQCVQCPATRARSSAAVFGFAVLLAAVAGILFKLRDLLPLDIIKIGVSMVQIIASANTAYDIPWPPVFSAYLDSMKVFLVSVACLLVLPRFVLAC